MKFTSTPVNVKANIKLAVITLIALISGGVTVYITVQPELRSLREELAETKEELNNIKSELTATKKQAELIEGKLEDP